MKKRNIIFLLIALFASKGLYAMESETSAKPSIADEFKTSEEVFLETVKEAFEEYKGKVYSKIEELQEGLSKSKKKKGKKVASKLKVAEEELEEDRKDEKLKKKRFGKKKKRKRNKRKRKRLKPTRKQIIQFNKLKLNKKVRQERRKFREEHPGRWKKMTLLQKLRKMKKWKRRKLRKLSMKPIEPEEEEDEKDEEDEQEADSGMVTVKFIKSEQD